MVNDSGAGADKRVEFSDLQSEVLNGAAIGTSTAVTELQVDNLNLNGNTFSSTDTNGNVIIQPNGTGATIINESGAASDFRVEGDTDTDLLFVDASADRVGISTSSPTATLTVDGSAVFNESGADVDFRVEGDTDANLLFVDASADRVGIGTSSPSSLLTVAGATLLTGNAPVFRQTDTGSNADFGWQPTTNDYRLFNFNTSTETVRFLAGGGITFNGDTSSANALDDYEEGTWTPVIFGGTTAGAGTYAAQIGRYTKIGNKVTCEAQLTYSGHTGTGNMHVTLPTTVVNSANYYASASIGYCNNISLTAGNVITCFATSNLNYVSFYQYPTGGGASTAVPVDAAGAIFFSITYESQ